MSAPIDPTTITAIGGFTALTKATADYLALDPDRCTGLGGPDLRIDDDEDAAGADGDFIFPRLDSAWIITLVGDIDATSVGHSSETGYRPAVMAVVSDLKTALDAMKAAPDGLVHSGGTEQVWFHSKVDPVWVNFHICTVTFGLKVDAFA
jgi:hypothetical protein